MKYFLAIFAFAFFILAPSALAYDSGTHAFLTATAVDFYNKTALTKLPTELTDYLVDGALREDDVPRSLNHFYDPVYQRGLTYNPAISLVNIPGTWASSKVWAEDSKSQNSLIYKVAPTVASILSAVEKGKISDISSDSDFTWQRAIDLYKTGKKEEAMFALGHVIHLIEDAGVPDHTRDDPHPGGSSYEVWAAKFTPQAPDFGLSQKLNGKQPADLSGLGSYFDGIATYSNNNFYSRNTIGLQSGYNMPVADMSDLDVRNGKYYVIGHDSEGNEYPLLKKNSLLGLLFDFKNVTVTMDDDTILDSYWSLLSTKAAQYASGVLGLFFKTVEAATVIAQGATTSLPSASGLPAQAGAREAAIPRPVVFTDRSVVKLGEKIIESGRNFTPLGRVSMIFDLPNGKSVSLNIQTDSIGAFNNTYQIPPDAVLGNYAYSAKDLTSGKTAGTVIYSVVSEIKKIAVAGTTTSLPSASSAREAVATSSKTAITAKQCTFNANDIPNHTPVVFNEIAWMGGSETYNLNSSDEWFELRNTTGGTIDLSGWQIVNRKGTIKITFPSGTNIPPWGFFLLERTDDNAVPNIPANLIYTGALANADEGLEIFDASCRSIDLAAADSEWPAGDATLRRTMERGNDLSWYTSGSFNGKVFGTPRAANGQAYVPSQSQTVYVGSGGNQGDSNNSNDPPASPPNLLITEIMYNPAGADDGHEWVEIMNEGTTSVELSSLKFREGGSNHNLILALGSELLPPGGYAVIANGTSTFLGDFPGFDGSLFYASFSLNNDGEETALKYGDNLFATTTYASSTGAYGDGNSLQLVEKVWTWSRPTPGVPNVLDQSLVGSEESSSSPPITGTQADRVVVSELQVGGGNSGDEFIELYNPGENDVGLGGWSLQYVGGGSSEISSSTVFKVNFGPSDVIKRKRFFLITRGEDEAGSDLYYQSFGLSGGTHGGAVFLVSTTTEISSLSDPNIVDGVIYGGSDLFGGLYPASVPESGESLERKAFRDGTCFSALPGEEGEFMGNGCETGSSATDFDIRNAAYPQNFQSLPEPRVRPSNPAPFSGESTIARYSYDDMTIHFKWDASRDSTDSPSGIVYKIPGIVATTSLEFIYPLSEIGKGYDFTITAFDRDGMPSDGVDMHIETPLEAADPIVFSQPVLSSASAGSHYSDNWYRLGRGFSGTLKSLTLRGAVDSAQFFSSHVYLKEFEDSDYSHEINSFTLSDNAPFTDVLKNIKMQNLNIELNPFSYYRLDTYQDYQNRSVILLGTTDRGTAMNNSFVMDVGRVESYYEFFPFMVMEGIEGPEVDVSVSQKPTTPRINQPSFDKFAMALNASWSTSTDLDSLDSAITYEYNVTNLSDFPEGGWRSIGGTEVTIPITFPNQYKVGVRAVDDSGERSDISSATWEFPSGFFPYILTPPFNSVFQDWKSGGDSVVTSVEFKTADFFTGSANPRSNSCRVDMYDVTDGSERMVAGSLGSLEGPNCAGNPIFNFDPVSSTVASGRLYRFRFYFDICAWAGACGVKFYGTNEDTAGGLFSSPQIKNAAMIIKSNNGVLFSNF